MEGDLNSECVKALRSAAERLGVDPYRLARFLANGRLGEILDVIGSPKSDGKRLHLAEEYLRFLDQEIADRQGQRPGRRGNRG